MIRDLTYHNDLPDLSMIQCPLYRINRPQFSQKSSHCSMGALEVLPFELVLHVLQDLDIESVLAFKQVNSQSKAVVESLLPYQRLKACASDALQVLVATGLAAKFSVRQLFSALTTELCDGCGDFGPFVFLPTLSRRCNTCLFNDPSLRVITVSAAKVCYGLNTQEVRGLPTLLSLAAIYGDGSNLNHLRGRRLHLVSEGQALALAIAKHGSRSNMETFVDGILQQKLAAYAQREVEWRSRGTAGGKKPQKPRSSTINLDSRGMASTPFPSLNPRNKSINHGTSCKGCRRSYLSSLAFGNLGNGQSQNARRLRDTAFSESGFLDHFKECAEAKLVWFEICRRSGYIPPSYSAEFVSQVLFKGSMTSSNKLVDVILTVKPPMKT